jgi:hypothetical protein
MPIPSVDYNFLREVRPAASEMSRTRAKAKAREGLNSGIPNFHSNSAASGIQGTEAGQDLGEFSIVQATEFL